MEDDVCQALAHIEKSEVNEIGGTLSPHFAEKSLVNSPAKNWSESVSLKQIIMKSVFDVMQRSWKGVMLGFARIKLIERLAVALRVLHKIEIMKTTLDAFSSSCKCSETGNFSHSRLVKTKIDWSIPWD